VVAEYVEDGKALALLRTFGVDLVQGYYLDRPVANHPALNC
jgi:EAL domain-containing protein (putative c-di-GMP-specific phosphodiesterase class I)